MSRTRLFLAALLACAPAALAAQGGAAPAEPVRVVIHALDAESRRGIDGMEVRVPGLPAAATDRRGILVLAAVPAGSHAIELSHRAYGTVRADLVVSGPGTAEFELPMPRRATGLDPLTVSARRLTATELTARSSGRRQNVLTREDIEARRSSARDVGDLVRTFPSLMVTEEQYPGSGSVKEVCITDRSGSRNSPITTRPAVQDTRRANRRDASMPPERERAMQAMTMDEKCEGVAVAVDDRLVVGQAGEFLKSLSLDQVESVSYLRPAEATARFGTSGGSGVILVYTRGNGPTVRAQ
jgi:hypothetical protein